MRDPDVTSQVPDLDDSSVLDAIPGLAEVARLMADAVAVTDLHRRVVVWNDAAAELYGIAADQAVGRPVDALLDSAVIGATVRRPASAPSRCREARGAADSPTARWSAGWPVMS